MVAKKKVAPKSTKKPVAKKASAKKTTKKTTKPSADLPDPVKDGFTKAGLAQYLSDGPAEVTLKQAKLFLQDLENTIIGSVRKGGNGIFMFPGLFKIECKKIPARPARKGTNPFTGEPAVFKAKPASIRVKIRPLTKLKKAAGV